MSSILKLQLAVNLDQLGNIGIIGETVLLRLLDFAGTIRGMRGAVVADRVASRLLRPRPT